MKGNKRLKSLRKSKGMTQQELADASGVSVQAIQKIETGNRKIGATTAEKVANFFILILHISLIGLMILRFKSLLRNFPSNI